MSSYIHNLDRESLLMLYMAGELPAEDQAELEAMLASDAALRTQLEQMQSEQQALVEAFAGADAKSPLPAPQLSSVRRVGAAMAQWHVDRLAKPAPSPMRARRKFGWVYATAAALLIAVGTIFVLWSRVDDGKNDEVAKLVHELDKPDSTDVAKPAPEVENVAVAPDPDDYTPAGGDEATAQLTHAERDLYTLATLTDSLRSNQEAVTP
jgi:anti-sigma-K factor RskA